MDRFLNDPPLNTRMDRFLNEPPLTTREAARELSLKPSTLEVWRVRGGGPVFLQLGRAIRYRREDLLAFMESSLRESTSDPGDDTRDQVGGCKRTRGD